MTAEDAAYRPDGRFIAYIFLGSPPKEPRLWFLDRHLYPLAVWGHGAARRGLEPGMSLDVGEWRMGTWADAKVDEFLRAMAEDEVPYDAMCAALSGICLHYQHWGTDRWSMVWQLTDTTIPHVHNFGHDDTWRLGVWPD